MADVTSLIEYYVNLLIIQYHQQPRARALMGLFIQELLANGVLQDVQAGYKLTNTTFTYDTGGQEYDSPPPDTYDEIILDGAVGVQLDVLGKYAGVDRFYRELNLINFFACTDYIEVDPDADEKFGFTDYTDFSNFDYNGTLTYDRIISQNNRLLDEYFRIIIELAIIKNTSNFSHKSIDDAMYRFFGGAIRPESNGDMIMDFFVTSALTPLIVATLYKKLLPSPMGVGVRIVNNVDGLMFGMSDYNTGATAFAYGFSDYTSYASIAGQVLTYNQITDG